MLAKICGRWVRPENVKKITHSHGTIYITMDDSTESYIAQGDQETADQAAAESNRVFCVRVQLERGDAC